MKTLGLGCLVVLLGGCGGADDEEKTSEAYVAELDALIDGYEAWPQVAVGITEGASVHGAYVENWLNDIAKETVDAAAGGDMPDGAILVKQGYDDAQGTTKKNLTVMWKTEGEWFWAQYNEAGENRVGDFAEEACVGCHETDPGAQDLVVTYDW